MSAASTSTSALEGKHLPATDGPAAWRDRKRYAWLLGLVVPLLPLLAWHTTSWTRLRVFWLEGPIMVFVLIPLLDWAVGADASNPPEELLARLEDDRYYRRCTYAYVPLQYASLIAACHLWGSGRLSTLDGIALAMTVGCVGGIAINTAHELGHKHGGFERWLSKIALAQSGYGHFFVEHNRGHHANVATPDDPASARLGESFYAFWPRTVAGSIRSALAIERRRLRRLGSWFWTPRNDVLNAWAMTLALYAGLSLAFGLRILPYLALQAAFGFTLLELVNYMEHYGLLRQRGPDGRYERCRPEHSWNSNHLVSNLFLYQLQRHSDHHANPTRRYQALRHYEGVPNLPSGYATMILVALIPPLWRRVMDWRIMVHYRGDLSRANRMPRRGREAPASAAAREESREVIRLREVSPPRRFRCPGCAYVYDERLGHPREGFAPGTRWAQVPADWACPTCGVRDKMDFEALDRVDA